MISVHPSNIITHNWVTSRCSWFSDISDIPDTTISIKSVCYGDLIAFTSHEIKEYKQQELIDYLTKCHGYCTFTDSFVGTEWKGLIRKTGKPELVFAESDSEWFLLQCKYPDIIRVY